MKFRKGTVRNRSLGRAGIFSGGCWINFHDSAVKIVETNARCKTAQNPVTGNEIYCEVKVHTNEIIPLTTNIGSVKQISIIQQAYGVPLFRLQANLTKNRKGVMST